MKVALLVAVLFVGMGVAAWRTSSGPPSTADASSAPARSESTMPVQARTLDPHAETELDAARARIAALEAQVHDLRVALDAAEESRIQREREFLRFTEGISKLGSLAGGIVPTFATQVPPERAPLEHVAHATAAPGDAADAHAATGTANAVDAPSDAPEPAPVPVVDEGRSHAIYLDLRALLAAEQVQGIDLLETGNLQKGFVGPVVMRLLDPYGRPIGSLTAERLRLEASRAARMVTIVLEQGCERRDGGSTPFAGGPADEFGRGGQRRIVLSDCDPRPWLEGMPELFPAQEKNEVVDDGRLDLAKLRATLNTLLFGESGASVPTATGPRSAGDSYKVVGITGVQGSVLREIALDQFDREGRLVRRLFADRMTILRETHGLQILLQDGSQVRGEQKMPFLDGRYRIFLPRADVGTWEKAGVPGLAKSIDVLPAAPQAGAGATPVPLEPHKP